MRSGITVRTAMYKDPTSYPTPQYRYIPVPCVCTKLGEGRKSTNHHVQKNETTRRQREFGDIDTLIPKESTTSQYFLRSKMGLEPSATQNGNGSAPKTDYYNSGSNEPAQTSKLVLKRLESVSARLFVGFSESSGPSTNA